LPDDLQRPAGRSGRRRVAPRLWPHGMVTTCGASVKRSSGAVHLGAITLCIDHDHRTRAAASSAHYLEGTTGLPGARASGGNASSQCGISTRAEDSRRRITSTPTRLKAIDSARTGVKDPVTASTSPARALATACPSRAPIISRPYRVLVGPAPKYWRLTTRYADISPPKTMTK